MRRAPLLAGLATLALAWGVVPWVGLPPFSAHMLAHMAVVAIASPLLALGLGWRPPLGALPASMIELVGVWAWHAPALHHLGRHTVIGAVLEQATFLGTGLALWCAALGGTPEARRAHAVEGIAGLLLTSAHMTLLGALIGLAPRTLYGHGTLLDQQVGAAIMLFVGALSYLAGGLALVGDLLRAEEPA